MENLTPEIQGLRINYSKSVLDESKVDKNPLLQFDYWLKEAITAKVAEPNAMTISTVDALGFPGSRIVLLRGISEQGFKFYTNYHSSKGHDIEQNPKVALNFFWPDLERQVRVYGIIERLDESESDAYFASRPRESQIGAWTSNQSEVIQSREELEAREKKYTQEFDGREVPRPEHWGGYLIKPVKVEFWQGRPSRLHDRLLYSLEGGDWKIERLAP